MPKGKIVKKGVKAAIKKAGGKAKLGGGAVLAEKAVDVVDNPYISAAEGAIIGGAVGGVPGAIAGGLIGFVLADGERVTPVDMIAIPAYQYSAMLQGREPTFQIFIKEGELIAPVKPTDFMESSAIVENIQAGAKPKRKLNSWQKYIKQKKNHIKFKSGKNKGKLNLKAMSKAFKKGRKK
tara:strand:- start:1000 stop:1539 length:540 start_codon:yes stop_codon:yes gene_type:complete